MMRIKRYKLLLLFLMLRVFAVAQTEGYHYRADIKQVDSSGFYNIVLTPEINKYLKPDYSDLRIVNDSGKWVSHIIWFPYSESCHLALVATLKIIKNENNRFFTDLIVESTGMTSELKLEIKNTLAERFCTLSGSDDRSSWFIINDSITIKPEQNNTEKYSSFSIKFPAVAYRYFKIHIYNDNKDPFNIVNIESPFSYLTSEINKYVPLLENPPCIIEQKDSGNKSYIKITQHNEYSFCQINLKISGAKYYFRNAALYFPTSVNHSFTNPGILKQSIVLSNNSNLEFRLDPSNAKVFYLVIQNEDNLPLKIDTVKTSTGYLVATAWLEKGRHYKVLMGNKTAAKPNYDLTLNNLSKKLSIPIVDIDTIKSLPVSLTIPERANNSGTIWFLIIVAILVLAFFTYKLITDINKSKS